MDSITLLNALNDSSIAKGLGFDESNFVSMFIPNTYQVFWDTDVETLLSRMNREYKNFWNESRQKKAEAIGLSSMPTNWRVDFFLFFMSVPSTRSIAARKRKTLRRGAGNPAY